MKSFILIGLFICILVPKPGFALEERVVNFDSNLHIRIIGTKIPDEDAARSFNYAKSLYSEKKFDNAMRLLNLIANNYNGELIPEVNFFKSKILYMQGYYDQFYESYKKNFILYKDNRFVNSAVYTDTLERAIEKLIEQKLDQPGNAYSNAKNVVKFYMLYSYIAKQEYSVLKNKVDAFLQTRFSYDDLINTSNGQFVIAECANAYTIGIDGGGSHNCYPHGYYREISSDAAAIIKYASIDLTSTKLKNSTGIGTSVGNLFGWKEVETRDVSHVSGRDTRGRWVTNAEITRVSKFSLHKVRSDLVTYQTPNFTITVNPTANISNDNFYTCGDKNNICLRGDISRVSIELASWENLLTKEFGDVYQWASLKKASDVL